VNEKSLNVLLNTCHSDESFQTGGYTGTDNDKHNNQMKIYAQTKTIKLF